MKKFVVLFVALMFFGMGSIVSADNWTEADGFGDLVLVNTSDLSSVAQIGTIGAYEAQGPFISGGNIDLKGLTVSKSITMPSYQSLDNLAIVCSKASGYGLFVDTFVAGQAFQAGDLLIGSGNNYAAASELSIANFESGKTGLIYKKVGGGASAWGNTVIDVDKYCHTNISKGHLTLGSMAWGDNTDVAGSAILQLGAVKGGPEGFAAGNLKAELEYSGDHFGSGSIDGIVKTTYKQFGPVTTGSVKIGSTVTVGAH